MAMRAGELRAVVGSGQQGWRDVWVNWRVLSAKFEVDLARFEN